MIQAPAASGFAPSQSVVDGIAKIFDTFGPDAVKARAAQLALTKAQTAGIQSNTDYAGDRSAQGWAGIGVQQQNANTEEKHLPILKKQVDILGQNADTAALGEDDRYYQEEDRLAQERKAHADEQINIANTLKQKSDEFEKDYQLRLGDQNVKSQKLGDETKQENERNKLLQLNEAEKLTQTMPIGPERDSAVYHILRQLGDEGTAKRILDTLNATEAERQKRSTPAVPSKPGHWSGGVKFLPGGASIDGLPQWNPGQ